MTFIQIIQYTTDRFDEMQELADRMREASGMDSRFTTLVVGKDRDQANRYVTMIEFPTYEEAMANSDRPEVKEFAAKMQQMSTSGPEFLNLEVVRRLP